MVLGEWEMVNGELKESAVTGSEKGSNEFRTLNIQNLTFDRRGLRDLCGLNKGTCCCALPR